MHLNLLKKHCKEEKIRGLIRKISQNCVVFKINQEKDTNVYLLGIGMRIKELELIQIPKFSYVY